MSRTFRHVPFFARYVEPYMKTYAGLGIDKIEWDDRNRYYNGYDGVTQSYIYPGAGTWKDRYEGKTRKYYKRRYHKDRRQADKRDLYKFLQLEDAS